MVAEPPCSIVSQRRSQRERAKSAMAGVAEMAQVMAGLAQTIQKMQGAMVVIGDKVANGNGGGGGGGEGGGTEMPWKKEWNKEKLGGNIFENFEKFRGGESE